MHARSSLYALLFSLSLLLFMQQDLFAQISDIRGSSTQEKLACLNEEWKTKQLEHPLPEMVFSSQKELIQHHLLLVEQSLRKVEAKHLTESQIQLRGKGLDVLKAYRERGLFPVNDGYAFRIPYFIDSQNTACAVGYMIQHTGYEALAEQISEECNNAYIREMNFPALSQWAADHGFEVDELAWIQPGYGPVIQPQPDVLDLPLGGSGEGNVFDNDRYYFDWNFPSDPTVNVAEVGVANLDLAPGSGEVFLDPNGSYSYTAFDGFTVGADSFVYSACIEDVEGYCPTGTVYIGLHSSMIKANVDAISLNPGETATVQILMNDLLPVAGSELVGVWKLVALSGGIAGEEIEIAGAVYLSLYENGNYVTIASMDSGLITEEIGSYELEDGMITLSGFSESQEQQYAIVDGQLVLSDLFPDGFTSIYEAYDVAEDMIVELLGTSSEATLSLSESHEIIVTMQAWANEGSTVPYRICHPHLGCTVSSLELMLGEEVEGCVDPTLINPMAICPLVLAPVCGCDGITYDNDCLAMNLGGVTDWTPGPCGSTAGCIDESQIDLTIACIEIYDPVCGCDGVTYGNFCEAEFYGGVTDYTPGECGGNTDCIDESIINFNVLCPSDYDPVCGCDGITYTNECQAINYNGVTSYEPGECGANPECIDETMIDPTVLCPLIYMPVCGCDGVTYSNDCEATYYGGVTSFTSGPCSTTACVDESLIDPTMGCDDLYDPVCGCDGITYGNPCEAQYYGGVTEFTPGECGSTGCIDESVIDITTNCLEIYDPVCGCDGVTYGNECEAYFFNGVIDFVPGECSTIGCVDPTIINLDVICPAIFMPVCGCNGVTYSNECEAINYGGVTSFEPGECGVVICEDPTLIDPNANCDTEYAPVCGCDGLDYLNTCLATSYSGLTSWTEGTCSGQEPYATDDIISIDNGLVVTIVVLVNDQYYSDVTVSIIEGPANGTVTIVGEDDIQYIPNEGFAGEDIFVYQWCYTDVDFCQQAVVTITVAPPELSIELADDDATIEGTEPTIIDILANDTWSSEPALDPEVSISMQPDSGTATITEDNQLQYIAEPGFTGEVTIEYTLCLGTECEFATLTLQVDAGGELNELLSENSFSVYPNPAGSYIQVINESGQRLKAISLTDLTGRELIVKQLSAVDEASIDLNSVASGMYLLQIETEQGRLTKKVQVIR